MSDGDVVDAEWEETFFERCRRQRWAWANAALPQIGKAMWTDADVQWFMLAQMQRSLEEENTRIATITALVAVGRELVFALEHGLATIRADGREELYGIHISLAEAAIAKWRRLEGS